MESRMGTDVKEGTTGLSYPETSRSLKNVRTDPIGYPSCLMILSLIMWNMSFVGMMLRWGGTHKLYDCVRSYFDVFKPFKRVFQRLTQLRKPPDRHKSKPKVRKSMMLLGLMMAMQKANSMPTIELRSERSLQRELRELRGKMGCC